MMKISLSPIPTFLLLVTTSLAGDGPLWKAGEPIPLGVDVGPLVKTSEFGVKPMMTADVFGNGPYDLLLTGGQLLPFRRFSEDGSPVYGRPEKFEGRNLAGYTDSDGFIRAVGFKGNELDFYRYDKDGKAFNYIDSQEVKMATRPGTVAVIPFGNEKLGIIFSASAIPNRNPPGPHHHSADYRPFDGSGIWRGELGFSAVGSIMLDKKASTFEVTFPAFEDKRDIPIKCTGMAAVSYGDDGGRGVVAAASQGMFYYYPSKTPDSLKLGKGVFAVDVHGIGIRHPGIFPTPVSISDPESGNSNLIVGDTSFLWFYKFAGRFSQTGGPVYEPPVPVKIEDPLLSPGSLPVIGDGDLDGDGLTDLVTGSDLGDFFFYRNIGDSTQASFAAPLPIMAGGERLKVQAGYTGIQGPGESRWGYTCPRVFDWNGDGLADILYNSILGDLTLLLQTPGSEPPAFDEPVHLLCDTMELHLVWRTQPAVTDWGIKGSRPCMIVNDEKNQFRRFWRIDDHNVERGDVLRLTTGEPIQGHGTRFAGQLGRTKLQTVDWDGDGVIDLLAGTGRTASIPGPGGIPDGLFQGEDRQSSVLFLRNAGSNEEPVFEYPKLIKFDGERIGLGAHSCSPLAIDLGRGVLDLLVGEEGGSVLYFSREDLSW